MRERDLVLDQRQFALVLDATKGSVVCYVGSHKVSLAGTDRTVKFDGKQFVRCSTEESIQGWPVAEEGDYIVLENPAADGTHPNPGSAAASAKLSTGRKVNVPGPVSFPLWPGQRATVRPGHALRSNQFLVAVVYNDEEASRNWGQTVMKPSQGSEGEGETKKTTEGAAAAAVKKQVGELTMGKRLIIKGTDVSFFIPPTGIEVVPDEDDKDKFVRDAVTLETLEYCILVDENGKKRYVRGPDVVFPEPTEDFVRHQSANGKKTRKFRAIELNPQCGIYVKVIEPYEEGEKKYQEGDELFITGAEQRIYFPRAEHALVRYDGASDRIFAITIPAGEARYVLDKEAETIKLVTGPKIFLPDPRNEVVVRRVLTDKEVSQWFPGNDKAQVVNRALEEASHKERTSGYVSEQALRAIKMPRKKAASEAVRAVMNFAAPVSSSGLGPAGFAEEEAAAAQIGDEMSRQTRYTPPRELVIDSKFDGAVLIDVWTGYAVSVRSKTGKREVVVGPKPRLLEYDETLDALDLSMGTPKTRKQGTLKTVYLRVKNNRVSDKIQAETMDLVDVSLVVAYRVDFESEPEKWFQVEDYVQLLTEHTRSVIRNHMKKISVKDFVTDSVAIIRDIVLGKPEEGKRPCMLFEENGMVVKDVEVLDVKIGNDMIAGMLVKSQQAVVTQELELAAQRRSLELTKETERVKRERDQAIHETAMAELDRKEASSKRESELALEKLKLSTEVFGQRLETVKAEEAEKDEQEARRRARAKASHELEVEFKKALQDLDLETLQKGTEAIVDKLKAISPDLIAALQVHGDKVVTAEVVKELGAVAAITGDSVDGVFKRLMQGSVLADVFAGGNGKASGLAARAVERAGLGNREGTKSQA